MVDGVLYQAHRLAWLYEHGVWPSGLIDHVDENKQNNRLVNLRVASLSENATNQSRPQRNNKLGIRGVCHTRSGYQAQFRGRHLGFFETPEQAYEAYEKARRGETK